MLFRSGSSALIEDSLVHSGCLVEGEVQRSILFPGVRVEAGAKVKDSVLLFDTIVEPGAVLDKTITDVEVRIGAESVVGDSEDFTANREFPDLLNSGITLIGRGVEIPRHFQDRKSTL